jgi:hypothetical protein
MGLSNGLSLEIICKANFDEARRSSESQPVSWSIHML